MKIDTSKNYNVNLATEKYCEMTNEKDIFKNITIVKELKKVVFDYIKNGNQYFNIEDKLDKTIIKFIKLSAKEYVFGKNSNKLTGKSYLQKMRLAPFIGELIVNATIMYHSPLIHESSMFINGFNNFQGIVKIDNSIFRYIVRIGKAKVDNIFYDISLKKIGISKS